MKIFIDSADVREIQACNETGLINGVTTNPTLIMKSGRQPYDVYRELEQMGIPDISMEVMGTKDAMISEGIELHELFGNVATIKLPLNVHGLKACQYFNEQHIRTNVTLVFNAAQAILAAKAGATYVSPFVGRIDDQGYAGTEVVRSVADLVRYKSQSKVLAASIRSPQRVVRCFYNGADIVTMPPKVFWEMFNHVLTDKGMQIFENDYQAGLEANALRKDTHQGYETE